MDARRSHEHMDTYTMLLIASMVGLILLLSLVVGLVTSHRRRARLRLNRRVNATITHIQVEASSVSSWWTITAEWTDPQTGQHYHFRGPRIRYSPRHLLGKQIAVRFNATRPQDYHMEL
jgi:hypothetical protein